MSDWMRQLSAHYGRLRSEFPHDPLMIVFDIDGTILDMRHLVWHLLVAFDREHGTRHFFGLTPADITRHENHIDELLVDLAVPSSVREHVRQWYLERRWSPESVLAGHQPYRGVLEVIRWFQLQPNVEVGLNTGRPDYLRQETLTCLNTLGREYRVQFREELLWMHPGPWDEGVEDSKARGLRYFDERGHRVIAVIDNEPENLEAMLAADGRDEILFLHAETLFESTPRTTPRTVGGDTYDLRELIGPDQLPGHVTFVWHEIGDRASLQRFLGADVGWGECRVRFDPHFRVVVRPHGFDSRPWSPDEKLLPLEECLAHLVAADRRVKIDLCEGGLLIDRVLYSAQAFELDDDQLWLHGEVDVLGEDGFGRLRAAHPGAIIQCPIDFLIPLLTAAPAVARQVLDLLSDWGIDRFSVMWSESITRRVIRPLDEWGYQVNIYGVPDLEAFLQAALMLPASLTSDFLWTSDDYRAPRNIRPRAALETTNA